MNVAKRYFMGVDLGQRRDYSAVALLEERLVSTRELNRLTFAPVLQHRCALLHLDRLQFGMRYSQVVDVLYEMLTSKQLRHDNVILSVDATGVGSGVFENIEKMVAAASAQRPAWMNLAGVIFTAGGKQKWEGRTVQAPKNELMGDLLLAMENQEIRIGRDKKWTPELCRELKGMRRVMGETRMRWVSVGEHDDLVMALALAQFGRGFRPLPGTWKELGWKRPEWEVRAMREAGKS